VGSRRRVVPVIAALAVSLSLAGCVATAPAARPSSSVPASAAASPAPTPAPAPTFVAGGTAETNQAYFDAVNTKLFAANGAANGRAIIDSLVAAGFDKASMQLTPDTSSVGGAVDSILFSVRIGDSCLLGQHGGGGYSSAVEAALKSGACLIGKTRAIDW
jgi:hypothetical protein